jgi:hypothetical protein
MPRTDTPYFLIHQSRAGTAFPPVKGVPTMAEWTARHGTRSPWWQRLIARRRA